VSALPTNQQLSCHSCDLDSQAGLSSGSLKMVDDGRAEIRGEYSRATA